MTNVAMLGFVFGRELWGWRAWVPLAVVAVISLLITQSLRPLRKFFTNIWEDWTLLTFGLFGSMPLVIAVVFDEMDRLYSLYFMVILTLLMVNTAFVYMQRPDHYMQRPDHRERVAGIVVFSVLFSPALLTILPFLTRVIS